MYDVYIIMHEKMKELDDAAWAEELAFIEARAQELRARGGGSTLKVRREDSYDFHRMRLDEPQTDNDAR